MHLSGGTRLGPYEILAPVGAGGMGEVYRGRDTRLGREVAIKVLPLAFARDAERLARFDREARAVSSLNHPHICILHDIGHQDGIDYLVMEYIDGETLHSRLARGPLPLEQALRYAIEIAGALALSHRQGVCHRDLKPANIMLTKAGTKLLDFGLARLRGSASSHGRTAGDIFVQPFPGPGPRIQISNEGGGQPRWSHDGTRIFYIQPDKKLMEARFDPRTGCAGVARVLFQTRIVAANFVLFQYDVSPDGRFLINSLPAGSSSPLTLITGWTKALKQR